MGEYSDRYIPILKEKPIWKACQIEDFKNKATPKNGDRLTEILRIAMAALPAFGALFCAPPVSLWISNEGEFYNLSTSEQFVKLFFMPSFYIGLLFMTIGLVVCPAVIYLLKKRRVEDGAPGRFISSVGDCIDAIHSYETSEYTRDNQEELFNVVLRSAQQTMGDDSRVCVYKWGAEDDDPKKHGEIECFVRQNKKQGTVSFEREPTESYSDSNDEGKQFINLIRDQQMKIVVPSTRRPPHIYHVMAHKKRNVCKSLLALPVVSQRHFGGSKRVVGAICIEFSNKKRFINLDLVLAEAIAGMIAVVYTSSADDFNSSRPNESTTQDSTKQNLIGSRANQNAPAVTG